MPATLSRLAPGSYARAVWLVSPSVIPRLFALTLVIKNVAGTENAGGSAAPWFTVGTDGTMRLLGRPVLVSEYCSALGTVGDVILADLSQYIVALRDGLRVEMSTGPGWRTDELAIRVVLRARAKRRALGHYAVRRLDDGQPVRRARNAELISRGSAFEMRRRVPNNLGVLQCGGGAQPAVARVTPGKRHGAPSFRAVAAAGPGARSGASDRRTPRKLALPDALETRKPARGGPPASGLHTT